MCLDTPQNLTNMLLHTYVHLKISICSLCLSLACNKSFSLAKTTGNKNSKKKTSMKFKRNLQKKMGKNMQHASPNKCAAERLHLRNCLQRVNCLWLLCHIAAMSRPQCNGTSSLSCTPTTHRSPYPPIHLKGLLIH